MTNNKLDKKRIELFQKQQTLNYMNGKFKSSHYTKEELLEKRKYFESQTPKNVDRKRWLYEIKRHFELNKDLDKYPDASLNRLEYILYTGHL